MFIVDVKLNFNLIDFFWIKLKNINELQLNYINDKLSNIKSTKKLKGNDLLIYIEQKINEVELKSLIEWLIKEKITSFKFYLIVFNKNIKILKTKIIKIFFKNNLSSTIKYYISFNKFLNKHLDFKGLMKQNLEILFKNIHINFKSKNLQVKIHNYSQIDTDILRILNLFCLFGNIKEIYFDFLTGYIYLKYESIVSINRLLENKSDIKFNSKLIDISFCNLKYNKNGYFIRLIEFNKKINIYNKKFLKIKYNSPSKSIIICNISKELGSFKLYNWILKYGNPLIMRYINKVSNNTRFCIIQFKSIYESIRTIIFWSNRKICKNKLKIAFSFNNLQTLN